MSKKSLRKFGSGKDIGMSLLWYWISYVVVTWIGIGHTIFNILVLHMGSMAQGPGLGEGYEMTKPWHPLYNIILFTIFGLLYPLVRHQHRHRPLRLGHHQAPVEPHIQAVLRRIPALDHPRLPRNVHRAGDQLSHLERQEEKGCCVSSLKHNPSWF